MYNIYRLFSSESANVLKSRSIEKRIPEEKILLSAEEQLRRFYPHAMSKAQDRFIRGIPIDKNMSGLCESLKKHDESTKKYSVY